MGERETHVLLRVFRFTSLVDVPAMMLGGFAAAFGHRWGGLFMLANVVVQIGSHLAVGTAAYRDTMARPWPKVVPLADDPWDD